MSGLRDDVTKTIAPSPRVTGSVFYAPVGTPLPTTSYATLNAGFTDLGYTAEEGLKQKETRANTDVFVWGGDLLGNLQTNYSRTMSFKLYQFLDDNVLAAAYGNSNIKVTAATSQHGTEVAVNMNSQIRDTLSWVFDGYYFTAAGYEALVRVVLPMARIIEIGDVDLTNKAFMSADVTKMMAFPDAVKNHGYLYVNDGVVTGGAGLGGS
jgi:hypothetical protein